MFLLVILVPSATYASMSCGPRGSQNLLTNYEMEKPYLQWFQSSADPSSLLQSKNIAHTFLAVKSNPKSNASHVPPKKRPKRTSLYPSIAFPPSNKTSKRTSQAPILTTKLDIFFFSLTAFLSWLRLSIYMAIVSIAILLSFHLKLQPSALEKQFALPLGIIFWVCIYSKLVIHCFLCCCVLTEKNKKPNVVAGFGMHYIWIE